MSDDLKVGLKISTTTPGADQVNALKDDVRDLGATSSRAAGQQEAQADASEQQGKKAREGAGGVSQLRTALEGLALAKLATDFVRISAAQEANRKALDQLAGSAQAGAAEMEYLRGAADRLGVNLDDAARAYVGLSAATKGTALEGQNTRAIFEAVVGAMSKLGKSSAETQNALLAVSQMASKGTISMEDLRGQLGEALPGAMQAAAKAMGVTVAELDKMVSSGTVTADQLLPRLAEQLNATFGSAPPDTLNAAMAQLENKITAAVGAMTEAGTSSTVLKGAFTALGGIAAALADIFNSAGEAIGVVGKGIAATFFSIQQALSGDFKGALASWKTNMADAMDTAATNIDRVRKSVGLLPGETQAAAENTKPALAATATAADQLAAAFSATGNAATGMAGATGAAAQSVAQQYQLDTLQGVLNLADAFTIAGDKAQAMSTNVQAAIGKMGAAELASFSANLKTAFETGQIDAQRFAELNNTVLAQSFKGLGLDVDQAFGGISAKTGAAINSVDALVTSLQAAGQTGPAAAQAIGQALAAATNRADTIAGVESIKAKIEGLRGTLGETLTNGLLQQATDQATKLGAAIDAATPGINSLAEAYKTLGITSDQALRQTADKSREAAGVIEQQGGSVREVSAAWQKYLQDAIAANGGASNATIEAQAAAHGLQIAVDASGKAMVQTAGSAQQMGSATVSAAQAGAAAVESQTSALEANIAAREKALDLAQRQIEVSNREKGLTADGFVANSSGQKVVGGGQVYSELGVINYLKQAGMDEASAVQTAKKVIGPDGNPVWNTFGTNTTMLASQLGVRGNFGAYGPTPEQLLNSLTTQYLGQKNAPGASPTNPAPPKTVNVNLNLPGGGTKTVPVQGDAAAQALIDALKAAGLTSSLT